MRLLTFYEGGELRLGILTDSGVVDVQQAAVVLNGSTAGIPLTIADAVSGGAQARRQLEQLAEQARRNAALVRPEAALRLGPCVPDPGKIIGIGLNYRRHAEETGAKIPTAPVLFSKFSNSLAAHGDDVPIPPDTQQMDYEAELALVIGRQGRHIAARDALNYVYGYFNANDVSARDLQSLSGQWLLGKTADGFLPIGPYLVTADEVADPHALSITCTVNGQLRQNSSTADLIFSLPEIISYVSRYITLEPGDIISTGTPEGVALGRPDKPWLQPGDVMTVTVGQLGALTNRIAAPGA